MPVKKHLISTVDQAYDYAMGSAKAAKAGVCPSCEGNYLNLASQVTAGAYGTTTLNKASWTAGLADADAMCINAPDYKKRAPVKQSTPGEAVAAKELNVSPTPPPPPVVKAGFPWWIVLLLGGGALVYYLSTKKKGPTAAPKKTTTRKRRRRRKR
jgi:hypothetical protein